MDDLRQRAAQWLNEDPDPQTRAELEDLLARVEAGESAAAEELADAFDGTLQFGTAGLRGALGPGPNRMNRVVVTRAAAGLVDYLISEGAEPGSGALVVIGYDARRNSDVFARDTAEIVTGAGLRAVVLPRPLPTPVLAYAIGELGAVAGVMVTASHNPPQDNGYKVYLGDGSQIVPPADTEIAARIAAVGTLADLPRGDAGEVADEALITSYAARVGTLVPAEVDHDRSALSIVYTPLHGVGGEVVARVLGDAGFTQLLTVPTQAEPDGSFPTVSFPNPEEPGAIDLAVEQAMALSADLVIANDPDADRCAVAVPTAHGWQMLRGDEVGALLADHLLRTGHTGVYATSIVSSSLLGRLAAAYDQPHAETLTGFKWIGRIDGLAYGYEEALGYCVDPTRVKDKDGVSAALLLCEIAAAARAEGRTLSDLLDDLARTHGLHATDQLSVRVEDLSLIAAAMERIRTAPPRTLGGLNVERIEDLSAGTLETTGLPPTDGLRYSLADGARVIVRPSGTEPKLKCYLEVVTAVVTEVGEPMNTPVDAARISAAGRLDAIAADLKVALGI